MAQYDTDRDNITPVITPPIENDPIPGGHGNFYTVGANITSISGPVNYTDSSNENSKVTVTFIAEATTVEFYWGLYLVYLVNAVMEGLAKVLTISLVHLSRQKYLLTDLLQEYAKYQSRFCYYLCLYFRVQVG